MDTTLDPRTQRRRRSLARSMTGTAIVSFSFAVLPLIGMAPAHADTTVRGCTVAPLRPYANFGKVMYPVAVKCPAGRTVEITQRFYEDDPGADQTTHSARTESVLFVTSGNVWVNYSANTGHVPPNTEPGADEIYHTVSFRVHDTGGWSAYTAVERSALLIL
jgi:hypothetical protein